MIMSTLPLIKSNQRLITPQTHPPGYVQLSCQLKKTPNSFNPEGKGNDYSLRSSPPHQATFALKELRIGVAPAQPLWRQE